MTAAVRARVRVPDWRQTLLRALRDCSEDKLHVAFADRFIERETINNIVGFELRGHRGIEPLSTVECGVTEFEFEFTADAVRR